MVLTDLCAQPTKLSILVCADVDEASTFKLSEKLIVNPPRFDAVIICGPFIHQPFTTKEECAVAQGDMASIIAQFENIVCRVIYLPSEADPVETVLEQVYLTPNSVTIHERRLTLAENLFAIGFSEHAGDVSVKDIPANVDRTTESDDEMEDVTMKSGNSVSAIAQILQSTIDSSSNKSNFGVFALNYKYAHTLNQVLFHMPLELEECGVGVAIFSTANREELSRLPQKFGNLFIVAPQSLRLEGSYAVLNLLMDDVSRQWKVESISTSNIAV